MNGHMNWHGNRHADGDPPPDLLVLVQIFAKDRILLIKRGIDPYSGKWAPPGGFVERGELPEHAATREVREEVQLDLEPGQLLPHSVILLPWLNQTYHVFIACLPEMLPARAVPPESIEVGWFSKDELARIEMWDPDTVLNTTVLFDRLPSPPRTPECG